MQIKTFARSCFLILACGLLLISQTQKVFGLQFEGTGQADDASQFAAEQFSSEQAGNEQIDASAPFEGLDQFEGMDAGPEIEFDIEGMEGFGDENFEFASELTPEEAAAGTAMVIAMFVGIGIMSLLGFILVIWVAYSMMDALSAIPEEYRELSPAVPWLLLVPVVNIVVLFLVFIKVPDSLNAYLTANGDTAHGDCGRSNGLIGSILYILGCTFPIGLVLLVMSLMKISQAKQTARQFASS